MNGQVRAIRPMLPPSRLVHVTGEGSAEGGGESAPTTQFGITDILKGIECTIDRLHEGTNVLGEQIRPILTQDDAGSIDGKGETDSGKSGIYLALEGINARLLAIESHVHSLARRVDL